MAPSRHVRIGLRLEGLIQGVGFRPHVAALARAHGLGGFVRNDGGAVTVEAEGAADGVAAFTEAIVARPPPRARIDAVAQRSLEPRGETRFRIAPSEGAGATMGVAADAALCGECLRELFDPDDRRHRYPFISCLHCGPRYSIVEALPYDRERTTFAPFSMCARCRAEHEDPASRRHHAQTTCCPDCGPTAELRNRGGCAAGEEAVREAVSRIGAGRIVAVKGMGGHHLVCRADDEGAIAELRRRKRRPEKPLAIMVRDVEAAEAIAALDGPTRELLTGADRPVVLAPRRGAVLACRIAGEGPLVGLMLPATPFQHLLLDGVEAPLVMTSANASGRPMMWRDDEARADDELADALLTHGVGIAARCDDAVVRRVAGRRTILRAGRGGFPAVCELEGSLAAPTLGVGAELKNTVCLGRDDRAVISPHIGDLGDYAAYREMVETASRLERLEGTAAARIACDLHPDYASTRFAQERAAAEDLGLIGVQHHHAHFAACLADAGHRGEAIGVVLDGTGYGLDGAIWGGEIFVGTAARIRRAAHLAYVPMPGGAAAIREPWRMALAHRMAAGLAPEGAPDERRGRLVAQMVESGTNAPPCSSTGRLFDAVAAMIGAAPERIGYDAHAAMRLEALASRAPDDPAGYRFSTSDEEPARIDPAPAIRAIDRDRARGVEPAVVARRFHEGLAEALADACALVAGPRVVALAGGVCHNDVLVTSLTRRLERAGLSVLRHRRLPPNDGAIAFGQICVAAARDREESP